MLNYGVMNPLILLLLIPWRLVKA